MRVQTLDTLSGIEFRFTDAEFENYSAFTVSLFADREFNIAQDDTWQHLTFSVSNARTIGQPAAAKLKRRGIYIADKGNGPTAVDFAEIAFVPSRDIDFVFLTFDDGCAEHWRGARAMHGFQMRGTAYIMPTQIGQPRYRNLTQLKELHDIYDWGVSAHHAEPFTAFAPEDLIREIDTLPPADTHLLRAYNVLTRKTPEELAATAKQAIANGEWAILMFHFLVDDEPQSELDYRYTDFVRLVELLGAAQIPVVPVHEVIEQMESEQRQPETSTEDQPVSWSLSKQH